MSEDKKSEAEEAFALANPDLYNEFKDKIESGSQSPHCGEPRPLNVTFNMTHDGKPKASLWHADSVEEFDFRGIPAGRVFM